MATSPATVPKQVSEQVTWGLLGAWAVHDLEELCTMAPTARRIVARLRARYPQVPDGVWERLAVSPAQAAVAVGLLGGVLAAAAAAGRAAAGAPASTRPFSPALAGTPSATSPRQPRSVVMRPGW